MGPASRIEALIDSKGSTMEEGYSLDLTDMLKKGGTIAVIDIHGVPAGAMACVQDYAQQ